jgi:hypothetical protein
VNPKNQPSSGQSDEGSAPESILDTEYWANWNGDFDNPNDSTDDCMADVESDMEQDYSTEDRESPVQRDLSIAPNVSILIRPTQKSKRHAEKVLVMVNAIETRRNKRLKTKLDRMSQCFTSIFMYLD